MTEEEAAKACEESVWVIIGIFRDKHLAKIEYAIIGSDYWWRLDIPRRYHPRAQAKNLRLATAKDLLDLGE